MDETSLAQVVRWTGGNLRAGSPDMGVTSVVTDSRALHQGAFFVALRGERFDGHAFLAEAAQRGAVGALVEEVNGELPQGFAQVQVADTLKGLQQLAGGYRRSLSLRVIGVTGSNGKTSTKDLVGAVVSQRFRVTRTEGNLNNHIGLPITLLRASKADAVGVFEMGMNHPGEIAPLAELAQPGIGIITNIGEAHIEFMGSREAIAQEKGMLAEALPPGGTLILSAEDEFSPAIARRSKATVVLAGISDGDVRATGLRPHLNGTDFLLHAGGESVEATLPVPGEHMVRNALLAAAAGIACGLSLEECAAGMGKLELTKGRLQHKMVNGVQFLDDTYNANPDSMAAALRTLSSLPATGRRIAVLGMMGELGQAAEAGHRRVGGVAGRERIDCVLAVGTHAAWTAEAAAESGVAEVLRADGNESATQQLRAIIKPGDLVLVKGSRSARMECVIEGLLAS